MASNLTFTCVFGVVAHRVKCLEVAFKEEGLNPQVPQDSLLSLICSLSLCGSQLALCFRNIWGAWQSRRAQAAPGQSYSRLQLEPTQTSEASTALLEIPLLAKLRNTLLKHAAILAFFYALELAKGFLAPEPLLFPLLEPLYSLRLNCASSGKPSMTSPSKILAPSYQQLDWSIVPYFFLLSNTLKLSINLFTCLLSPLPQLEYNLLRAGPCFLVYHCIPGALFGAWHHTHI